MKVVSFSLPSLCLHIQFLQQCSSKLVWDNCGAVNSDRLEKVQTEAARIVTSYAGLDSIYCETGWEKINMLSPLTSTTKNYS
jgi:hypothetical protein